MKKLIILLALTLSVVMHAEDKSRGYIVKVGDTCPNFEMTLSSGEKVSIADLKGKVVMLQFTASWCSVCRKEMPHIEKDIWQKHKNNPAFALYGLDMDEPVEKVTKYWKDVGVTYPSVLDDEAKIFQMIAEKGAGVTRNVIVDKDGTIAYLTRLFNEEEFNAMKEKIEQLLAE